MLNELKEAWKEIKQLWIEAGQEIKALWIAEWHKVTLERLAREASRKDAKSKLGIRWRNI